VPDFEAMPDAELRQFKSGKVREIQAARAEMRAADVVLMRKRAHADDRWRRAVTTATALRATGDEHSAMAERLAAMDDDEFAQAELAAGAAAGLSREERRALAAKSANVLVPSPNAGAVVLPPNTRTEA
jgi:hypothetical protein